MRENERRAFLHIFPASDPVVASKAPTVLTNVWRSLAFFNAYRLVLGGLLGVLSDLFGSTLVLTAHEQSAFFWISALYIFSVLLSVIAVSRRRPSAE